MPTHQCPVASKLGVVSSSFNLPSYPAIRHGSLTPLVPSIAGSHHVSSTWPPNLFPSRPTTLQLTIDQANNIFSLVSECQAFGVRLAKDFQVLSGLEAIHRNSIQGTAHETLTLGHSTWEAAYAAILWDDIMEAEHEAMTLRLHSEADATWKKMHEVMYNHQLEYDRQLADFLKEAEMMLANMRDQIWTAVHTLVESEGMTFEDCLSLMLHVLLLLLQIPMDSSFQTQIPLTIAYCLESSVYRSRHSEQGGVSPIHKEVRASRTLTKVLGGVTHKGSEGMDRLPSPKALWDRAGHEAPELDHAAVPKVSPHTVAGDQALPSPRSLTMARKPAANPNPPMRRRMPPVKMRMWRSARATLRF